MDEKKYLKKGLDKFGKLIKRDLDIKEFLLFGSRAGENFSEESDVDLIIVSKDFEAMNFFERIKKMHEYWEIDLPVDFICYTPKEFEVLKKTVSIVKEALKNGVKIKC